MPAFEASILSLHHVTATVTDAQEDLDFYAGLLGFRLVKKTVNFDNHHVFHFYYGDEHGTPGTIWTTFPYKGYRVPVGRKGAGQINETAFSVPAGSLDGWRSRLTRAGVAITGEGTRFGESFLSVADPSGLNIEVIETGVDDRRPWTGSGVPAGLAIRGVHSVTLTVHEAPRSVAFLTDVLGWGVIGQTGQRTRLGIGNGGPGKTIDVLHAPSAPPAMNGLGTVHHVAMAIATPEEQLQAREALLKLGVGVTEVRDRQYFLSIYFREPGGVLYEIATLKPGFAVDEPPAQLGTGLKLPPWEEPYRAEIEAGLPAVKLPSR
jgi:glyoxalase family protein